MGLARRSKLGAARIRLTGVVAIALLLAGAAWASGLYGHVNVGLAPRANAWSATVAALLLWQTPHGAVVAVMATYLLARLWSGRLTPTSRATLDNIELFWRYTALQGALIAAGVQWLPRAMA